MQKYMTQPFVLFSWKLMYVIYVEICGLFTGLSPIFRKTSKLSFYFYIVKKYGRHNKPKNFIPTKINDLPYN